MNLLYIILTISALVLPAIGEAEYRIFMDNQNREIEAQIISVNHSSKKVSLKRRRGTVKTVPLKIFSPKDQQYILDWYKASKFSNESKTPISMKRVNGKKLGKQDIMADKTFPKRSCHYELLINNRSDISYESIKVEYCYYLKISPRASSSDGVKVESGSETIPLINKSSKFELNTQEIVPVARYERVSETFTDQYGNRVSSTGAKCVYEESVEGIWIKMTLQTSSGISVEKEISDPEDIKEKYVWSQAKTK